MDDQIAWWVELAVLPGALDSSDLPKMTQGGFAVLVPLDDTDDLAVSVTSVDTPGHPVLRRLLDHLGG